MEDLAFGLRISAIGMGLVFSLLGMLWLVLAAIGRIDGAARAGAPPPAEPAPGTGPVALVSGGEGLDPDALAAVSVAAVTHAAVRRRQAAPEMRATPPGSQLHASRWLASGRTQQTRGFTRGR
jgi:Na+-transporting methylmalonyl-CoA/oxaloacetate decarboxylase gamma subunit